MDTDSDADSDADTDSDMDGSCRWETEILDPAGGESPSIGASGSGTYLDIVYVQGGRVKHATNSSRSWSFSLVDLEGDQYVTLAAGSESVRNVAYPSTDLRLRYANYGGGWRPEQVHMSDRTHSASIAIDIEDFRRPHISYMTYLNGLRHARRLAEGWEVEDVDVAAAKESNGWSGIVIVEGTVHILYIGGGLDGWKGWVRHAWKDGDSWTIEEVDVPALDLWISVAADSTRALHAAYFVREDGVDTVRHATNVGGVWSTEDVDGGVRPYWLSLAVGSDDGLHLVYQDEERNLIHASSHGDGWSSLRLCGDVSSASVTVGSRDSVHVAFVQDGALKHTWEASREPAPGGG